MVKCKGTKKDGTPCNAQAVTGSDYCIFHGGLEATENNDDNRVDMSQAVAQRKHGMTFRRIFGREKLREKPRKGKLKAYEAYYDEGGIVSQAIDTYVAVATSNGYQFIDSKSGKRNTKNVDYIRKLDKRIDIMEATKKVFRSLLIFGFAVAEMEIEGSNITNLLFIPPYEVEFERDEQGHIEEIAQVRGGDDVATWTEEGREAENTDRDKRNILMVFRGRKHSEPYGRGIMQKIYEDAQERDDLGNSINAVTKFVAYPFRVVKCGSDEYPASEAAVSSIADNVDDLDPGDWFVTRHNLEFQFHAPEAPPALAETYKERTREIIVSLGVPSMYTSLEDIDAQTLKEIRNTFNSTVRSLQHTVATAFQNQVFKRQLELKHVPTKRDPVPVEMVWNPLSVSVLSILELTQLVEAGVIGISEARRIIESMGYGLLRGEAYREEIVGEPEKKRPKESHPTEDEPDKEPVEPPTTEDDFPPRTKEPATTPTIKRPQPNEPRMSINEWYEGIRILKEIDKNKAYNLLTEELSKGFSTPDRGMDRGRGTAKEPTGEGDKLTDDEREARHKFIERCMDEGNSRDYCVKQWEELEDVVKKSKIKGGEE